ncbi:MAG: hypothetical protein P8169_03995 [Chloroflexota bacterium]
MGANDSWGPGVGLDILGGAAVADGLGLAVAAGRELGGAVNVAAGVSVANGVPVAEGAGSEIPVAVAKVVGALALAAVLVGSSVPAGLGTRVGSD